MKVHYIANNYLQFCFYSISFVLSHEYGLLCLDDYNISLAPSRMNAALMVTVSRLHRHMDILSGLLLYLVPTITYEYSILMIAIFVPYQTWGDYIANVIDYDYFQFYDYDYDYNA